MRLKIAILFVCIVTLNTALAQRFRSGIKAGISTSQVSGDNLSGFHKAGLMAGALIQRDVTEKLSYQIEMIYIQKGSRKATKPDEGDNFFFLMKLNYLEVPLLLQYRKDRFIYEAGLMFGRLIHSSVENESGLYPSLHPESRPFYKEELSAGIGISYPLYNKIFMNWRITNSILPVRNHQGNATYRFNRGQYNTVMQFTFNYYIEGKPKQSIETPNGK
jgi:hypothetical protein